MASTSTSNNATDVNMLPTNIVIPRGVNQSAHALKTQITIPKIYNTEGLGEHARLKRKRGYPIKYWSCDHEDDVISKTKDHHLNNNPCLAYVRQRNISVPTIKKKTQLSQLTNQIIDDKAAIRTYSSLGHHIIPCNNVNGCLECYYGNTCYSYGNYFSGSLPVGYYSDMESTNQSRFNHAPYYPVKLPWKQFGDVIVDHCGELCHRKHSTKCKVKSSEPGPVIIECFSLGGKEDDKKRWTKNEEQTVPTPRNTPRLNSERNDHFSKLRLGSDATPVLTDGPERKSPRLNTASTQLTVNQHQQQQTRKIPILPFEKIKRSSDNDEAESVTWQEHMQHTYESKDPHSSPRKHKNYKKQDENVYEVYHSKFYKRTQQMMHNCEDITTISSKIQQDVDACIIHDDNKDKEQSKQEERCINISVSGPTNNTSNDKLDNTGGLNSVKTRGNSTEKHSNEESLKESRPLKEQRSKTSESDSDFSSQHLKDQENGKSLSNSGRLGSSQCEENMMLNHQEFRGNEMPTCKESVIQESPDPLKGDRVSKQEVTFDRLTTRTSESGSSQLSPNTQDDNGHRCISFLAIDADNRSVNGHDHQTLHDLQRRNSQDVTGVESTMSQRIDPLDQTSSKTSFYDVAMERNSSHFQLQNTAQTLSPERPHIRRERIDKADEQRKAIHVFNGSTTHPSQKTSLIGHSRNSGEETTIDPCSPESLSSNIWEKINQEMYQGTMQKSSRSKSYACEHCGREFSHVSSLNNHIRRHTGLKPFRCRFCGKRFAQSGVLTAHLRTHTGDRPFECVICKKRFAQTTTLANHIRTHTGHKPFICRYCKREFAQSSTRNKHELSHTKEKPYICKYCGRTFAQSATVTRHMRIHMRQDGFLCVHCGKGFPYLYALDKHLDSHSR